MINAFLFLYDEQWRFKRRIELPEKAEPNDMSLYDGSLLISDIRLGHIYEFKSADASHKTHSIDNI